VDWRLDLCASGKVAVYLTNRLVLYQTMPSSTSMLSYPLRRRSKRRLSSVSKTLWLLVIAGGISSMALWKVGIDINPNALPPTLEHQLESSATLSNKQQTSSISAAETGFQRQKSVNGWEQLQPPSGRTVFGEIDSFLQGKSCHWQESGILAKILSWIFFFSRYSYGGQWECRDCGMAFQYNSWKDCPIVSRRGKCSPFQFQEWDGPKHVLPVSMIPNLPIHFRFES
jgi:hypothetical protein